MTPSSAFRSFAITLAIAIAAVGPRASAFTIHREDSTPAAPTDLSTDERLLQVKEYSRILNDTTSNNEDLTKTNETHAVDDKNLKIIEAVTSTPENEKIPTISSDTVEVFDSVEDTKSFNMTSNTVTNSKSTTISKSELTEKPVETTENMETERQVQPLTTVYNLSTKTDQTENYPTRKTVERSIQSDEQTTPLNNVTAKAIATETTSTKEATEETDADMTTATEVSSITTDKPVTVSNISSITMYDITLSTNIFVSSETQPPTENLSTITTALFTGKYPKYTTIIRKQTTSSEEITPTMKPENNDMKAETTNTQVNFEKAFDITPIPSLVKLRADLLTSTNAMPTNGEVKEEIGKVTREIVLTTPSPIETMEPAKPGTVQTKRAGYLDNSEKATTPVTPTESVKLQEVSDIYGNVNNSATTQTATFNFKKVSGSESQSQLAEDMLQEELMREEALKNYKENAIRYHDVLIVPTTPGTEDTLSVQPIERTKTTLYTLGPNYKPMKKIDVQPAKPFIRDPDDNSWRNERISSLGIVFKPKNSSKSFKEVLRNKTQTELNSLVEQSKDNIPDLRVRLEKIAEIRKTKKKKMSKDGEMIYTDYEENSAETSTVKQEDTHSIIHSAEIAKMLAPLDSPGLPAKAELDNTTPMTTTKDEENKEKLHTIDFFNRLRLNPLTTLKPKKYFNIAEYYDTTDEYDADYVTMSKLDLKKFTPPSRTSHPAPTTRPVEPYVPERKATIQYFPPRKPPPPPQQVNVNNVDEDFERKINMFTFKDHPRIEPRPPFVTVPPLSIATAHDATLEPVRPGRKQDIKPDMRSTVKPIDLANQKFYHPNHPPTPPTTENLMIDRDRGSYVIKHYKDLLNAAGEDDDRNSDFLPYHTATPHRESFDADSDKQTFKPRDEDDYDGHFRKDVLARFVDNFNQNSDRFKIDFPILYNTSVVHRKESGAPAASRTYFKRLYHEGVATKAKGLVKKPCEPNCEVTVELSPAYELHYYVPNQEEREEQEQRTPPPPYRYGL